MSTNLRAYTNNNKGNRDATSAVTTTTTSERKVVVHKNFLRKPSIAPVAPAATEQEEEEKEVPVATVVIATASVPAPVQAPSHVLVPVDTCRKDKACKGACPCVPTTTTSDVTSTLTTRQQFDQQHQLHQHQSANKAKANKAKAKKASSSSTAAQDSASTATATSSTAAATEAAISAPASVVVAAVSARVPVQDHPVHPMPHTAVNAVAVANPVSAAMHAATQSNLISSSPSYPQDPFLPMATTHHHHPNYNTAAHGSSIFPTTASTTLAHAGGGGSGGGGHMHSSSGSSHLHQPQPQFASSESTLMVNDEDVRQFSNRTVQHSQGLWQLMCSSMDLVSDASGEMHMVCLDPELFLTLASQHQRLTGERTPRRPEDFALKRQKHCPYQCPPSGNGCPGCMTVLLELDNFCWPENN